LGPGRCREDPIPRDPLLHGLGSFDVHLESRDLLVAHGCVLGMLDIDHDDGIAKDLYLVSALPGRSVFLGACL